MQQLQKSDGADKHLKAAGYHIKRCRSTGTDPLFANLYQEMASRRESLKRAESAIEEQQEKILELSADADAAEVALEDIVRDISGGLERYDRRIVGKGAQKKVLPNGIRGVIDPEGEAQRGTLTPFRSRLKEFAAEQELAADVARFDEAVVVFEAALDARKASEKALTELQVAEENARSEIRKQLVKANGQLEGLFSARPALADRYFLRGARGNAGLSREERGRALGQAELIVKILAKRGVSLTLEEQKKLLETTDFAALERWFEQAESLAPGSAFVF